jgi:phthiodiolone/phenolphthiodiolone dimycocerosates ketoreductase
MSKLRVGVMDPLIASRPTVTASTTSNYFTAVMAGADSFWVPDHLNALLPRSLWKPQYCGVAKILPNADAYLEPWTMLGHLSARNRVRRLHLGVGVTDTGRRNPAITAQAAATLHLLSRGRAILGIGTGEREANEPYGVDWTRPVARFEEAMATIRALWNSKGQLVNPRLGALSPAQRNLRPSALPRHLAADLDRRARPPHAAGGRSIWRRVLPGVRLSPDGICAAPRNRSNRRL